jgi:DNA-binding protein YbaB
MPRQSVAELRVRHAELLTEYERGVTHLARLRERMAKLRGTARSDDALLTVTVDARGQLSTVEIEPRAFRRHSPTELGEAIVATARKAGDQVHAQMRELLAPFVADNAPLDKLMSGEADWSAHLRRPGL